MVTQRRHLRLLSCEKCQHLRASHYRVAFKEGQLRFHFNRPRDRQTPIPCHVLNCTCARFVGKPSVFRCPICAQVYAARTSLEIHIYGQHAQLSDRQRSVMLQTALRSQVSSVA
jgi:uncharacterized C2H2 Zn-finger protein